MDNVFIKKGRGVKMKLITELCTNETLIDHITKKLIENDGYCPCRLTKTEDTKCPCKEFREQDYEGACHCGLYIKVKSE